MRQYGFRGKSIAEEWHYGLLSQSAGFPGQPTAGMYISNTVGLPYAYQVIPESVGQYIEISDRNGKDIYEGDILKSMRTNLLYEVVYYGRYEGKAVSRLVNNLHDLHKLDMRIFEVVGNIYDNPELLGGYKPRHFNLFWINGSWQKRLTAENAEDRRGL